MVSSLFVLALFSFALLGLFVLGLVIYNRLVSRRNDAENAAATIDVQLKQRHDLLPNVEAAVRGYMAHERGLLERLTEIRSRAFDGRPLQERADVDQQTGQLFGQFLALAENYPQLKASEQFTLLQRTLNEVEAQIAAARRTYNASATAYNTACELFPANLVAGSMGFTRRALFSITAAEAELPRVFDPAARS